MTAIRTARGARTAVTPAVTGAAREAVVTEGAVEAAARAVVAVQAVMAAERAVIAVQAMTAERAVIAVTAGIAVGAASAGSTGSVMTAVNAVEAVSGVTDVVAVSVRKAVVTGRAAGEAVRPAGLAVKPTTTVARTVIPSGTALRDTRRMRIGTRNTATAADHRGTVNRAEAMIGHRTPVGTVHAVMRTVKAAVDATEAMSRAANGVGPVPRRPMAPATAVGTVTRPMRLAVTGKTRLSAVGAVAIEIIAAVRDTEAPRFVGIMTIGTETGIEPIEIGITTGFLGVGTIAGVEIESDPHGPSTMKIRGAGAHLDRMTAMEIVLAIVNGIIATITESGETTMTVVRRSRHPIITGCPQPGLPARTSRQAADRGTGVPGIAC